RLRSEAGLLGTPGTGWDVAWAAAFLASEEARWITGVTLPVDSGVLTATPLAMARHLQQVTEPLRRPGGAGPCPAICPRPLPGRWSPASRSGSITAPMIWLCRGGTAEHGQGGLGRSTRRALPAPPRTCAVWG